MGLCIPMGLTQTSVQQIPLLLGEFIWDFLAPIHLTEQEQGNGV